MSLRFTEEQVAAIQARNKDRKQALVQISVANGLPGPKQSKYRNHRIEVDGVKFDSKREYARWQVLKMLESAGKIEHLERQAEYILVSPVVLYGRKRSSVKYKADFKYYEDGKLVIEDVKSPASKTAVYILKRHLMMEKFAIEIRETA